MSDVAMQQDPPLVGREALPGNGEVARIELIAVVIAVSADTPLVLTRAEGTLLPAGPLETRHRSLQAGLRAWVEAQTGHPLGYVEQLYTFADRNRGGAGRTISISYLALARESRPLPGAAWQDWYRYFPWEDQRSAEGRALAAALAARLQVWAGGETARRERVEVCFGLGGLPWNEELVLARYELLYEAGLAGEAARDAHLPPPTFAAGMMMAFDHRRILATAAARLRAKIKYHPVIFELMPESFTLFELQRTVEAIAGTKLHKPNFRRMVESQNLVEETGEVAAAGRGRPARLYRFREAVRRERASAGTRLPVVRA